MLPIDVVQKNNMKIVKLFKSIPIFIFLMLPSFVAAAKLGNPLAKDNEPKSLSPSELIGTIVNSLLTIAGVLAVAVIVWGGVLIIIGSSQGKEEKVSTGRRALLYAIIGLIVAFTGYIVLNTFFSQTDLFFKK